MPSNFYDALIVFLFFILFCAVVGGLSYFAFIAWHKIKGDYDEIDW